MFDIYDDSNDRTDLGALIEEDAADAVQRQQVDEYRVISWDSLGNVISDISFTDYTTAQAAYYRTKAPRVHLVDWTGSRPSTLLRKETLA